MTRNTYYNNLLKRLGLLNRYYKITKFYTFLKDTAIKAGIAVVGFVALLVFLEYFFLDFDVLLNSLVENYSPKVVFSSFLISETILGLVPPEIYIAWASKSATPWLFLFVLATLSYIGGVLAYLIGGRLFLVASIKRHIEDKISQHIVNLRKWGSIFVVLGAVSPIPHSLVSMACGLIKFSFKQYLLWALFRYLRFFIYGLIIFQVF